MRTGSCRLCARDTARPERHSGWHVRVGCQAGCLCVEHRVGCAQNITSAAVRTASTTSPRISLYRRPLARGPGTGRGIGAPGYSGGHALDWHISIQKAETCLACRQYHACTTARSGHGTEAPTSAGAGSGPQQSSCVHHVWCACSITSASSSRSTTTACGAQAGEAGTTAKSMTHYPHEG